MHKTETKNAPGQTKQQTTQQQTGQQSRNMQTSGQGSQERGLSRRGSYPSIFSMSRQELFDASPFELMRRFSDEMERVFGDFGLPARGWSQGGARNMAMWSPAIETFEREGNLVVRADLPGLNKDDVKIEVTDDGLVIRGERKNEHEERGEGFYRGERSYGQFYRLIPLPDDIDTDQVRADFTNGVLEITVPVPERVQRRREIPIGAESGKQSKAASTKQT